jgi:hypothetical protein
MPDIELERLRRLRRRAAALVQTLVSDLKPFCHVQKMNGFVRKPDSPSDPEDVNVTTTCSCLMALALAGKLSEFYPPDGPPSATEVFRKLLTAPWMSSGLAENNAFTTTLVVRTFGFLVESSSVSSSVAAEVGVKRWEPQLSFLDFHALAVKLVAKSDLMSQLLYGLLPRNVQKLLADFVASGKTSDESVVRIVTTELGRIVRTTALNSESTLVGVTLSETTKAALGLNVDAYSCAHLNRLLLDDCYPSEVRPIGVNSLAEIARTVSASPKYFGINEYASSSAVIYWFVDGVARAGLELPPDNWDGLCEWAASEFARQRSIVVAKHAAMMDPIAMAMAACLCARLRSISNRGELGTTSALQAKLPSVVELEQSILELFGEQTDSGIWPKYFPLFHYQEAGSNFCFTFELLEAVLTEFGDKHNRLISQEPFIEGLERAVGWCEQNRLRYSRSTAGAEPFMGWNSGGFLETLRKGQPESWSTAVVHMFLWETVDVLSRHIQLRILEKYTAILPSARSKKISDLLDIDLWIGDEHKGLKEILSTTIVKSFKGATQRTLRVRPPKGAPLSALLFGPPGTSKTQVTKAVAADLGWPLVEIDPSHFLQSSFQNIYLQAEKIFDDIADLSAVVVLFDEMDALVQKRDADQNTIDTESKFLTTYMLPKLAKLHDRGCVVFFMATNFQDNFDDAIKRTGRFDYLLCMGPPTFRAKCDSIHVFYGPDEQSTPQTQRAGESIWNFGQNDSWLYQQLELYMFGEFKSLISRIAEKSVIGDKIEGLGLAGFLGLVKDDSHSATLRFDSLEPVLKQYSVTTVGELDSVNIDITKFNVDKRMISYLRDRKQSKRQ